MESPAQAGTVAWRLLYCHWLIARHKHTACHFGASVKESSAKQRQRREPSAQSRFL